MTRLLGILNVTPDSFSDGGVWEDAAAAIDRGVELHELGADYIDVGGESTRPGAEPIDVDEERRRVLPVVAGLSDRGVPVSIDTMHAEVARAAMDLGARIVNDVSGGLADPGMAPLIAAREVRYIAMHWRGGADQPVRHDDVVAEVRAELKARVAELLVFGVDPERLIVDPGLGFAKDASHNWALLGHLGEFAGLGAGVLVGASRKRFVGELLPPDAPMQDRDAPTAIITALAARSGAWGVRVHDVAASRQALDVWERWERGAEPHRAPAALTAEVGDATRDAPRPEPASDPTPGSGHVDPASGPAEASVPSSEPVAAS
jgi:dihydropteroate synthase